jgi:ribosomal protein L4
MHASIRTLSTLLLQDLQKQPPNLRRQPQSRPPSIHRILGTGRAVSCIPRVAGGETRRSGQAAFGNMCCGGRMIPPTRIWPKWHRKININQKQYVVVSGIAASAVLEFPNYYT